MTTLTGHAATLIHAAELLEAEAECLRESHTTADGEWDMRCKLDRGAKDEHDDMVRTATALRQLVQGAS